MDNHETPHSLGLVVCTVLQMILISCICMPCFTFCSIVPVESWTSIGEFMNGSKILFNAWDLRLYGVEGLLVSCIPVIGFLIATFNPNQVSFAFFFMCSALLTSCFAVFLGKAVFENTVDPSKVLVVYLFGRTVRSSVMTACTVYSLWWYKHEPENVVWSICFWGFAAIAFIESVVVTLTWPTLIPAAFERPDDGTDGLKENHPSTWVHAFWVLVMSTFLVEWYDISCKS